MESEKLRGSLSHVLDQIDPGAAGFDYRLVGTAAALLQGVELPVGDLDVLVARRADVDRAAARLAGFPCPDPPAWLPDSGQYFTRFQVEGVTVEFSTVEGPDSEDPEARLSECAGRGPWQHYVHVVLGRHVVPAVRLELRLATELARDRPDRYTPLISHLRVHGADLSLLTQAMRAHDLEPARQDSILRRLLPR